MVESRRPNIELEELAAEHVAVPELKPLSQSDVLAVNTDGWNRISERLSTKAWLSRRPDLLGGERYPTVFRRFCRSVTPGGAVLDVGCGKGVPLTRALVDSGFQVTGIDLSEAMIRSASINVPEARLRAMSMTDLEDTDALDGVVSSYSMLCLEQAQFDETAGRIARALRVGGHLFLALNEPGPGRDAAGGLFQIDGIDVFSHAYSETDVRRAFAPHSMRVVQVEREVYTSELYGTEHCLIMLLTRDGGSPGEAAAAREP